MKRCSVIESRTCPCGAAFQAWPSQPRKHCSQVCSWRFNGRVLALKPKACEACGASYQPTSARQKWCTECKRPAEPKRGKAPKLTSSDKAAQARLRRYGLTVRQWDEMAARHDGQCWICRDRPATVVDHDHETGKVRGALCRGCNMALHFVERPGWWDAAIQYLEESDGPEEAQGLPRVLFQGPVEDVLGQPEAAPIRPKEGTRHAGATQGALPGIAAA